jgi:hypothetical protein
VLQVGADGYRLLDALDIASAPSLAAISPAVAVLRRVWARHFERADDTSDKGGPRLVSLSAVSAITPERPERLPQAFVM